MTRFLIPVFAILVSLLLHSCANIAPPSGGRKDEKKPKVTKTIPSSGTTNFKGKEIKYVFTEWIAENKLKEQIIITPKIEEYEIKINKNVLTIKFDTASLKKNTTYYFNLRDGIKDITEGNTTDSTTLVFATGNYLDSLEISGIVKTALTNEINKNITVGLYYKTDTFSVVKNTADYQTKTEPDGSFSIKNIKPGKYLLYAINDENKNSKYEANKEFIGYLENEIELKNSITDINIDLVKEDHENTRIKYVEKKKNTVPTLEFNKGLKSIEIKNINKTEVEIYAKLKDNKVSLYANKISKDSIKLEIYSEDLNGNKGLDTVNLVYNYLDTAKILLETFPSNNSEIEPSQPIEIKLSKPYKKFNPKLTIKTAGEKYTNQDYNKICTIQENKQNAALIIQPTTNWKDTVKIEILPTSFETISGTLKDTVKLKLVPKQLEKYGSIGGKVECATNRIIVQLLSKDGKIIKEIFGKKDFLFEYLTDGEYKIRVIEDLNENYEWDQGDYRTRKLLEPIHHFPEVIKLKSNWEILDVKISF